MRPFKQSESAMTKTAKVLSPSADTMYSAPIQQQPVRDKVNFITVIANALGGLN